MKLTGGPKSVWKWECDVCEKVAYFHAGPEPSWGTRWWSRMELSPTSGHEVTRVVVCSPGCAQAFISRHKVLIAKREKEIDDKRADYAAITEQTKAEGAEEE